MKIGISSASFFNKVTTENSFKVMQLLGFDIAEVFLTTFYEYESEYVDYISRKKRLYNIDVWSVHSLNQNFEPELYNSNQRTYEDAEFYYKKLCYAAKTLGAKYYTFHGPALLKRTPYVFDFEYLGERTRKLCSIIEDYGAKLSYENVHWTYFSVPEYFDKLKKYAPDLKACLDIKQAMQSKIDYLEYLKVMGDRLVTVHLCDYDEDGKLKLPGKGVFNFVELFKNLKGMGYDGPLILELYSKDYEQYTEIADSLEYLKECLIKI